MRRTVKAAIAYFAIVFVAGFLLGTLRVLLIAPRIGEQLAVLFELPLMLAISWITCGRILDHFSVPGSTASRLAMGGIAFGLLMAAELAVSMLAFKRTLIEHIQVYQTASAVTGLLAQIAFALFPLLKPLRSKRS